MQNVKWYIRDSGHLLEKIKNANNLLKNAIPVTADVVDLYPSIPIQAGLSPLKEVLENIPVKENLIEMVEFVLKSFSKYQKQLYLRSLPLLMHAFT